MQTEAVFTKIYIKAITNKLCRKLELVKCSRSHAALWFFTLQRCVEVHCVLGHAALQATARYYRRCYLRGRTLWISFCLLVVWRFLPGCLFSKVMWTCTVGTERCNTSFLKSEHLWITLSSLENCVCVHKQSYFTNNPTFLAISVLTEFRICIDPWVQQD